MRRYLQIMEFSSVNEGTKRPIASSLSITWYQEVNGMMYQMQNAGYNAGAVVEVD
jgi:hypothetical protein